MFGVIYRVDNYTEVNWPLFRGSSADHDVLSVSASSDSLWRRAYARSIRQYSILLTVSNLPLVIISVDKSRLIRFYSLPTQHHSFFII